MCITNRIRNWNRLILKTWFMQHAILLNLIHEPDIQNNDRLRATLNSTNFWLTKIHYKLACSLWITLSLQLSWNFCETFIYIYFICAHACLCLFRKAVDKTLANYIAQNVNAHLTSAWCKLLALQLISQRESMATPVGQFLILPTIALKW